MRQEIMSLLHGQAGPSTPAFSGLIHITAAGLQSEGLRFHEVHQHALQMAKTAASTFRLTGMPSAALPLDLCAPAEALGVTLDFYEDHPYRFPQPAKSLFPSTQYLNEAYVQGADFLNHGRLPLIRRGIEFLQKDIGDEAVISGILPGPYTLLLYLLEPGGLFAEMKREPHLVKDALSQLSLFLGKLGVSYREAGADFLSIHEMGGSPGFLGPAKFEQFVHPALKQLMAELPQPVVLSVCGNTNKSMDLLAQTGARALSVDQMNDLSASRPKLNGTLLFGNVDPVTTLFHGDDAQITQAIREVQAAGVDAVWPGCDLVPQTPIENIKAFVHRSDR